LILTINIQNIDNIDWKIKNNINWLEDHIEERTKLINKLNVLQSEVKT